MRILYFTAPTEDYLSDSLLHGLRSLLGEAVIDFPKCEILYRDCPKQIRRHVRGNGFTLYGLLDDIPIERSHVIDRVIASRFDLIVFSDIWRQFGWFVQLRPWLSPTKTVLLDGSDSPRAYPNAGWWWRRPYWWFLPRANHFLYFKREWNGETQLELWRELLPLKVREKLSPARNLRRTAFSIPAEKVVSEVPVKTKDFPAHIVDRELAERLLVGATGYAFENEDDYYADLRASRFGITTRRAGWDCLRHYEIAANGAVPCFRELFSKPTNSAPHGLDENNCLDYRDADDLFAQIAALSPARYAELQAGALRWVANNTTVARARAFLDEIGLDGAAEAGPGSTR